MSTTEGTTMTKALMTATDEEIDALVAKLHAEKFPTGCGGARGSCEACVKRLGIVLTTCPVCRNARVQIVEGRISGHDRLVGGRRNYRARPQECEGSRMKVGK
jgi:hypothetical protein